MAVRLKTDWVLFISIIAMMCLGLVMVYSASSVMAEIKFGSTWYFIARQLLFAAVAFIVLMYARKFDYRRFDNPVWAFAPLGLVTGLLVLVYFVGRKHRWLDLGPASLQPSVPSAHSFTPPSPPQSTASGLNQSAQAQL